MGPAKDGGVQSHTVAWDGVTTASPAVSVACARPTSAAHSNPACAHWTCFPLQAAAAGGGSGRGAEARSGGGNEAVPGCGEGLLLLGTTPLLPRLGTQLGSCTGGAACLAAHLSSSGCVMSANAIHADTYPQVAKLNPTAPDFATQLEKVGWRTRAFVRWLPCTCLVVLCGDCLAHVWWFC